MNVRAGAARRRLRRRRPPLGQWLSIWFERLVYVGVLGGILLGAIGSALDGVPVGLTVRPGIGLALAALLVVSLVRGGVALGPLFAGRAATTWLLSTPIDRRAALLGHGLAVLALGAAAGVPIALVAGAGRSPAEQVSGALGGVVLAAALLLVQSSGARWQRRVARILDAAVVLAVLGWIVAVVVPDPAVRVARPDAVVPLAGLAVVAIAAALYRLGRIDRRALRHGADLATVTTVSVAFLDLAPLSGMLLDRRARALGRVRSIRLGGGRRAALLGADLVRCTRTWTPALVLVGLLPVPALVRDIGFAALVAAAHAVATTLVTDRFARGLRLVCRSAAVRRALGGTDRELRLLHLAVPAAAAVVWSAAAGAIAGLAVPAVALSAVGAVLVVYRSATRPPLDYGSASYDVGLFGPTPVGLLVQLARGPALLCVVVALQLVLA
jgi:hypothetical protein